MPAHQSSAPRAYFQRAACHEAGHAAAVILSSGSYWLRGISMRPQPTGELPERYRHSGAHLTIEPQARPHELLGPEHRPQAEALLIIVLAGAAAERMFLGQRQRERVFRQELASHGLCALLHAHGGECLPEYRRWLQARAVQLVNCHWRGISRLAAALLEWQDLSGQQAEHFLKGQS